MCMLHVHVHVHVHVAAAGPSVGGHGRESKVPRGIQAAAMSSTPAARAATRHQPQPPAAFFRPACARRIEVGH